MGAAAGRRLPRGRLAPGAGGAGLAQRRSGTSAAMRLHRINLMLSPSLCLKKPRL